MSRSWTNEKKTRSKEHNDTAKWLRILAPNLRQISLKKGLQRSPFHQCTADFLQTARRNRTMGPCALHTIKSWYHNFLKRHITAASFERLILQVHSPDWFTWDLWVTEVKKNYIYIYIQKIIWIFVVHQLIA